jgi:hypothetical protein
LAKAKVKAEKIVASLGVKLLGVYDFIENTLDEESPLQFQPQPRRTKLYAPAVIAEPALGIDIQHSKTVQIDVDIWYRISSL